MTKYKIFCRADSKGARWCEYSGIFETMEDAADSLIFAANQKVIAVNGKDIIYKVKPYETTEEASRSAECINYSDVQAEVYEKVKAARKIGETEKLNEIRDKYGYDLYKWALDELIEAAKNLVDYFNYHNKNITKAQEEKIEELKEILKLF